VKKNLLRFFLSLIAISVVVTWLWFQSLQIEYAKLFKAPAQFAFRQLGIPKSGLMLVLEHFTNLVPYIALCLSLPTAPWKKRFTRLGLGLAILIVVHYIMLVAVSGVYSTYSLSPTAYKFLFPILTISDALPLVLWFLFFSEEIIGLFRKQK
jgi:hypothetical protein